jgi:hypothetical protein
MLPSPPNMSSSLFRDDGERRRPAKATAPRRAAGGIQCMAETTRRILGTSRKLGYPPKSSSPPWPDNATLIPWPRKAREMTNTFNPSIDL